MVIRSPRIRRPLLYTFLYSLGVLSKQDLGSDSGFISGRLREIPLAT